MLNSIGERTEPCGTPCFILLSLLRCPSLVCTTKLRFDNISIMKPTMCLSGMILSRFRTNSGWMLSRPGALPDFNVLMAASSSSTVKSDDRLASAVAALEGEVTSHDVQRAKSLSASGKRPLFISCEAIAFAVTGHLECVVLLPVGFYMVCHALRLECVKSTYSTTAVHLALRTSSSLWSSAVAVVSMSSLVVACWCPRRRCLQLSSHPGM